jgi:hypothetical protein
MTFNKYVSNFFVGTIALNRGASAETNFILRDIRTSVESDSNERKMARSSDMTEKEHNRMTPRPNNAI